MFIDLASQLVKEGSAKIFARGLEVAKVLGLPVTSWRVGDPTRSLYKYLAEVLDTLEDSIIGYGSSATLSTVLEEWAPIHAKDMYGLTVTAATYATPWVILQNNGGGIYPLAAGDLRVKATAINKTFRSTGPGYDPDTEIDDEEFGPGDILKFDLVADEAGSDSSVAEDEIDALVTSLLGVDVISSGAATASDDQDLDSVREQCRLTLGPLSPGGPRDAAESVCLNSELTGTTEITHAHTVDDSDTGDHVTYIASAIGSVTAGSVTLALAAVRKWANPLCGTPDVQSATVAPQAVTATVSGDLPSNWLQLSDGALTTLFQRLGIGKVVARSEIYAAIRNALVNAGGTDVAVNVTVPATDTVLADNVKPTKGTTSIVRI